MKRLLAAGVMCLGLVSCDSSDEMRRQYSVMFSINTDNPASRKAYAYVESEMNISGTDVNVFCERYLRNI